VRGRGPADDIVAITASMLEPTGLAPFAAAYPRRVFDVGIAEQHAVTSAAGLSFGGLHPVVAIYATFANRAFDQTVMDVALHRQAVTFVLDRAGVTGDDGASHNGMWDLTICRWCPGCGWPRPGTGSGCASCSARRSRSRTVRPRSASPRATCPPTSRRSAGPAAWTCCTGPGRRTC
jgi:1-deoxy-D-xylulose-5-phosphate synthase